MLLFKQKILIKMCESAILSASARISDPKLSFVSNTFQDLLLSKVSKTSSQPLGQATTHRVDARLLKVFDFSTKPNQNRVK